MGGNAVDAAIATNAAIAVTAPHLCGMGGDLFALVHRNGQVEAVNASGAAPSGTDAARVRSEGHLVMPFRHHIAAVTVPGCVDGWLALHARYGTIPLAELFLPAIALAEGGFPASPLLCGAAAQVDAAGAANLHEIVGRATAPGRRVQRQGAARALRAIAAEGRDAFYLGDFGRGLVALSNGWHSLDDLHRTQAEWVEPLTASAFGVELFSIPPNSQGYLALGSSVMADHIGLPADPDDARWAHLLIECSTAAGFDRPEVLHDRADGHALLGAVSQRGVIVDRTAASPRRVRHSDGDTTYLCAVDGDGMAVSLIQSNAAGFGSWLVEPTTGINLHNRGIGFTLDAGHPAELAAGRRPPHTLTPMLAMRGGEFAAVFGSMGGDAQPQIMLQLAARLFRHEQSPAAAINAGRLVLRGAASGFDTWTSDGPPTVQIEAHAPAEWVDRLGRLGHRVESLPAFDSAFGHAHCIVRDTEGMLAGAADPRTVAGSAAGH
jgi:gamma-glutamyltranspeptidase / glutathione hydrolase